MFSPIAAVTSIRRSAPVFRSASKRRSRKPVAAFSVLAVSAASAVLLRMRYLHWGASTAERTEVLAGDELLPDADQIATRAITINAAAEAIWPWLVQLGQGRGGFYSYTWLENLVPKEDIHNADRIVPAWQQISVGAEVRLHPEVKLRVAIAQPAAALVLVGAVPMGKTAPPYKFSWAFVLLPLPDGTTRLVVRERYHYTHRWAALIVQPAQLVSSLMSPKMLHGIKTRVERRPSSGGSEIAGLVQRCSTEGSGLRETASDGAAGSS